MNIITNRQINIDHFSENERFRFEYKGNDYVFPTREKVLEFFQKQPFDIVKFCHEGKKSYVHFGMDDAKVFDSKESLRKALSREYGGTWIEEQEGKRRYFIDEQRWFQRSIREVSKEEFAQKLEAPSTWQKILGIGLGILALAPGAVEFARHIPKEASMSLLALQQKSPILGTVGFSCLPSTADAQAMGTEFQVNTYTTSYQGDPSIAPLNDGGFVIIWHSNGQDGDGEGIFGQKYNASGARAGSEFQVNTYMTSNQRYPSVAPLNDGGFVVSWQSLGQDGDREGIFGQRFNASGTQAGAEFQVNTYTTLDQDLPSIALLIDGGFVITWTSNGQDGSSDGIFGQRFNANGTRAGAEFQVNTYTTINQQNPSVAPLSDGGFVVTWASDGQDGDLSGIYGQMYNATEAQAGTEFQVNTYWTSDQHRPSAALLNDGDFVIIWQSWNQDGSSYGIFGQRYNASGAQNGTEFQVNTYTTSNQQNPSVAPLSDGGFVVIWMSSGQDGDGWGIYGQRYNASGAQANTEFQVNTYTTNFQSLPSVAPLSDGGFVVTWSSFGQDGDDYAILGQMYDSNGTTVGPPSQASGSSALLSQMSISATQSNLSSFLFQATSASSSSLPASGASTQSSPNSFQSLFTSSRTIGTNTSSSNLNQSQPYTSSQSRIPTPSEIIIYSIIDIIYEEGYPIYANGQTIGSFTISGGTGLLNSNNPNVITMHFNPSYYPEEGEIIPLFSIPPGQATDWQSIQLEDTEFECLEARAEINPSTSGGTEFGLVFTGADSCAAEGSQIVASILPIMMNKEVFL